MDTALRTAERTGDRAALDAALRRSGQALSCPHGVHHEPEEMPSCSACWEEKALKLARGSFQRNLVRGHETLGGSTLRGNAKKYKGRYQASARALLARLDEAGIPYAVQLGPRGGWHCAVLLVGEVRS